MLPLQTWDAVSLSRKRHSLHFYAVLLGTIWLCTCTSVSSEEYGRVGRKLSSPLYDDHELLDASQLSNEDLHSLISMLEAKQRAQEFSSTTPRAHVPTILPELIRNHQNAPSPSPTTTTVKPPVSRVTTRRFYRRLRRKPTTQPPTGPSSSTTEARVDDGGSSGRMLPSTGPGELLNQLSLLNGILGALNSTSENSTAPTSPQQNAPAPTIPSSNDNANKDNATSVHDILALLAGANSEASSKSEVVVPPPSPGQVDDNTANALALLNLFSGNTNDNKNGGGSSSSAASNLLNLVAQSQPTQQQSSSVSEADATAALTKLLLQSSAPSAQSIPTNSIQQSNGDASANQLSSLLGLLGTLGAASGGGLQSQSSAGSINNLFNLGGDQQTAQAQQANSLASLFGGGQQQQQNQNLLNLFGGNQNQANRFDLASLLAPQSGGNSIPGLGLLSTMSSLGTSIFSTVSNLFGGNNLGGKPRVRGKGVDTRLGLGYRLGNVGDAQIVWDIGPQLFTDPLRNEVRPYTKKRESGAPASYLAPASAAAVEKEVQKTEAKRRMVQSAIHDQYHRNVYDNFPGVYPTKYRRSNSHFDYPAQTTSRPYYYSTTSTSTTAAPSFFSSGFSMPFTDHIKGFWSGLTSAQVDESTPKPGYYNFEDIRHDFSTNLIKRSSPDFGDYEGRAYHQQPRRRQDDYDTEDEQDHSTLTEYERMLLQYGKDMGIGGVPDTRHSSTPEPRTSESSIFDRWFNKPSSTSPSLNDDDRSYRRGATPSGLRSEWGPGSMASGSNEYPVVRKPIKKTKTYGHDQSFDQRNDHPRRNNKNRPSRPPQRRSHNPFRNLFSAFKPSNHHHKQHHHHHHNHHQGHRPRASPSQYSQYADFERRHYKRPGGGNPKLQHFTNMNKDLMMADANIDDFVQSAGIESLPGAYDQPFEYNYASEFPDVPLTPPPRRLRPSEMTTAGYMGKLRASLSHRDRVVEPALLYDHLEVKDDSKPPSEADESFHQRNKVVVNAKLREIEKQKVLGTASPATPSRVTKVPASLNKLQRMRLNKLRANGTRVGGRQKIIVKVKGKGNHGQYKASQMPTSLPMSQLEGDAPESSTALPSVFSTIGSIFSGTTKPKLLSNLIQNATSYLPSIRILPRKKNKDQKTRLTLMNGKPTVVGPPDDDDQDAEGAELPPVVQVGHDMSFGDLQTIFSASKDNSTKRRRFRIRVKESALKGETASDKKDDDSEKERKDSESEEDDEEAKDIFVDIESGEVSVLKPVASLVSFAPKQEEPSQEEEIDYYEDDDGDGIADMDMKRKEHIFTAIQKQLVRNFEKLKKTEAKAEAKKRRKEELAQAGMDESMDQVMKMFDYHQDDKSSGKAQQPKITHAGGLPL